MTYLLVEHSCDKQCTPLMFTKHVSLNVNRLAHTSKNILNVTYKKASSLNIRSTLLFPWLLRWTLHCTRRASPLGLLFLLNVKNKPIHPPMSSPAELDQGMLVCIFSAERLNICPLGNTGRVNSHTLVERLRLSDIACKARFYIPRGIENLFNAWALKALHGSLVFRWGEKPLRIFELLSHLKNQTAHISLGLISSLVPPKGVTFLQKPSRLNALRVTERNVAGGAS